MHIIIQYIKLRERKKYTVRKFFAPSPLDFDMISGSEFLQTFRDINILARNIHWWGPHPVPLNSTFDHSHTPAIRRVPVPVGISNTEITISLTKLIFRLRVNKHPTDVRGTAVMLQSMHEFVLF